METSNIIPENSRLHNKTIGFSFFYYIILFLFLSFIGWLWEAGLYLVTEHAFVNRGVLFGPWLPIYGTGGLFLYFLLYRLKKHPLLIFVLAAAICTSLEYFSSWILEKMWQIRWWDYTGFRFNINGRICLWASLAFGVGALLILYGFIPLWERIYEKIPPRIRKAAGILLLLLFVADAAYAAAYPHVGSGISDSSLSRCSIKASLLLINNTVTF